MSYGLALVVNQGAKLPVSAVLNSGPNVVNPVDMELCLSCGNPQLMARLGYSRQRFQRKRIQLFRYPGGPLTWGTNQPGQHSSHQSADGANHL